MARADEAKRRKQEEANRYRAAAENALQQLDWVVVYLEGIRKHQLARGLAKNRSTIRRRLDEA
jgi:hypothetical protein